MVEQVVISRIKVAKTQTPPDEKIVRQMMKAFVAGQSLEPITVCRPAPQMGVHLVCGRNELEAHLRLGRRLINAHVEQGGAAEAGRWREVAEIDEALLLPHSVARRAELVARRAHLYEMLHPGVPGFEQDVAARPARTKLKAVKNGTLDKAAAAPVDEAGPTPGYGKLLAAWNAASLRGRERFLLEVGLKVGVLHTLVEQGTQLYG